MISNVEFAVSLIQLSEGVGRHFYDNDLAKKMGKNKIEITKSFSDPQITLFIRKSKLSKFNCPSCGKEAKRFDDEIAICGNCGRNIDIDTIPHFQISINPLELEKFLTKTIISIFTSIGFTEMKHERKFTELSKNGENVSINVSSGNLGLDDYFALRGWQPQNSSTLYFLFCYSADYDLQTMSQKDPNCILLPISTFLKNDLNIFLEQIISERTSIILQNNNAESVANLQFEGYYELMGVKSNLTDIIKRLYPLALQQEDLTPGEQGRVFQKYIVTLLNLTIFKAKYLAGRDEPDGIIQLLEKDKLPIWIPLEIKTFKPKKDNYYEVKNLSGQLDKYSTAFKTQIIAERVSVPAFLSIAYDFDLSVGMGNEIIDSLERKHNIKYSFMPLKTFVHLVNLFVERKPYIILNDLIIDLMKQHRLITNDDIERLFDRIETSQKCDDSLFSQFRKQVSAQGI